MKNFLKVILLSFAIALPLCALVQVVHGQGNNSPLYRGPLNSSISIPVTWKGLNYKITGDRLADSSGVIQTYVDSVNSVLSSYIDSLFASVTIGIITDTTTAIIGNFTPGGGTATAVGTPHNTYGLVQYENDTGSPAGAGNQIKVAYSVPFSVEAIPVISIVEQWVGLVILDPQTDSFIVELQDSIAPGEIIQFSYHVKAQ